MSKTKTAEELLDDIEIWDGVFVHSKNAREAMIKFAKIHVIKALTKATRVLDINTDANYIKHPTKERILNPILLIILNK